MDKQFTPGDVGLEGAQKEERATAHDWFDQRAMWLKAAASAAANEVVEMAPATGAMVATAMTIGAAPALAIPYLAGTMSKSEDENVAAVGKAIEMPIERAKSEQRAFNEKQLQKPLYERTIEGAGNILKGTAMLAGAPLGLGPLGKVEKASETGAQLLRGPFAWYMSLADPSMTLDTMAADPFSTVMEGAPAFKGAANALRGRAATATKAAEAAGKTVGKVPKGLEVLAEILDPKPEGAHVTAAAPVDTVKRSPGAEKAAGEARAAGLDQAAVDYGVGQSEKPVKTRPTVEGEGMPGRIAASEGALRAAGTVGRALRGAMWGAVVLEPITALTGLPAIGVSMGALAVPSFKAAVRLVAKRKGMTPGEVQARLDQAFNDPNQTGRPDLNEAVNTVIDSRRTGASVEAFANAIGTIIEGGATPLDPKSPLVHAVPEPSRIGVKMSLMPDGSIAYDPSGVSMWFKHAADSADASVRVRVLELMARDAKSEANAVKWGLATPQERKALKTALDRRKTIDAATAANEKLLDRRLRIQRKLDELRDSIGTDDIQNGLAAYRQYRKALVEFEDFVGGAAKTDEARKAASEFRRIRRQYERGILTGTRRIEKMQDWFRKVVEQVGDDLNPTLIERAQAAAWQLDQLDANPKMKEWTRLVGMQTDLGETLKALKESSGEVVVNWESGGANNTRKYGNVQSFVLQLEKAQEAAAKVMAEIDAGKPMTPQRQAAIDKAQAMRSAVNDAALDYMMLRRERGRVASALDTIGGHFGGSPGQMRKGLAIELKRLRSEAAAAVRAEERLRGAVNKLSQEQGLNADVVIREQERFEAAKADAIAKNANVEAVTAMLESIDALFQAQRVEKLDVPQAKARTLVKADVEAERKLAVNEALSIELQREIGELIDANGELKAAFDAQLAAEGVDQARRQAKKDRRNQFPDDEKKAMARAKLAEIQKPFSKVSLDWNDGALQEMVTKVAALASEWAPFGAPIDPIMVRRMFSMAAMPQGVVHLVNKRAVGAMAEAMLTTIDNPTRQVKADLKNNLSKTVAQAVADSIKTSEWIDPVFTLPNGDTRQLSTLMASWMQTLSDKEKRNFLGSTAKTLGQWLSRQIQSHHMQGAVASDLASQMIVGDTMGRATPNVSFVAWATGEADKMAVPFNLAQLRQMLAGGPQAVDAFLRESMRYVPVDTPVSDLMMQRLSPQGVMDWMKSLDNYVQVVGSDVRAQESKGGALASVVGAAGGAALGGMLGMSDPYSAAVGVAGGFTAGAVMAPQFAQAFGNKFNNLRVFYQQVGGDLATQGYSALEHVYVHRGVASALDAQVAYIKNVSRTEGLIKILLTAFSLPTTVNNILSNDLLFATWGGGVPGDLVGRRMPQAAMDLAAWREGKLNPRDEAKWTAFAGTGLMESSVLGDVVRDFGTGSAGGRMQAIVDGIFKIITAFYTMQDGLAKAAAFSKQYDLLDSTLTMLSPGSSFWIDQGSRRYKKVTKVGDNIAVTERGKTSIVPYESQEYADLVAGGASVAPRQMFFDFSSLPNILRRGEGMLSAYAAPLFGWAYKAVDTPGKPGLVSAVLNGAPSTNYLTNDPLLLNNKAAEFAELAIRRSVLLGITSAEAREGNENEDLSKLAAYGIPLVSWVTRGDEQNQAEGVFKKFDMSAALPFAPTLTMLSLAANGVTGFMDLFGLGPETKKDLEVASKNWIDLTPTQRDQARWDRGWFNYYSGKGGTIKDLVARLGISGNFLFPLMAAIYDQKLTAEQQRKVAVRTLRMFMPKTPLDAVDVLVGTFIPDSSMTTRKVIDTKGPDRYEELFGWIVKRMTGIGATEESYAKWSEYLEYMEKRINTAMVGGLEKQLKSLQNERRMSGVTPEKRDAINAEYAKIKQIIRSRTSWKREQLREMGNLNPKRGWQ